MILKLYEDDGKTVVFVGRVPREHVSIKRPPNAPGSMMLTFPVYDALKELEMRLVDPDDAA